MRKSSSPNSRHAPSTPPDRLPAETSPGGELEQLRLDLLEKESLVSALTERLELAAEQLDRLHRSGADRGGRAERGTAPHASAASEKLIEDVQQVLHRWDEFPLDVSLSRIEFQLADLREAVLTRLDGLAASTVERAFAPEPAPGGFRLSGPGLEPVKTPDDFSEEPPTGIATSLWENLKSQLLDADESPPAPELPVEHEVEPPAPTPIDPAVATPETLAEAVDARDAYIAFLIRKLRASELRAAEPTAEELSDAPEELALRWRERAERLDSHLRLAEIELSLERARCAREESRLRQQQETVEKHLKRLGLAEGEPEGVPGKDARGQDRRWMRFLGVNPH